MKTVIFLTMILVLTSACSSSPQARPTASQSITISTTHTTIHATRTLPATTVSDTQRPSITPTSLPPETATKKPFLTGTNLPTSTSTKHQTITPTPTPEPLSQKGPWLLFKDKNLGMILTNWDGSGKHPLDFPDLPGKEWRWDRYSPPHGNYLLLRTAHSGDIASILENKSLDYQMAIMKLPEGKIIQTLPLLSPAAWDRIDAEIAQRQEYDWLLPVVFEIAREARTSQWSPDGRYLAFSAAVDSAYANLYLYDTQKDRLKRLTQDQRDAVFWAWSPDSQWIVYREATQYDLGQFFDIKGVWGVSITGEIKYLYQPDWTEYIGGWISDHSFIVYETMFEGPSSNLRKISIISQTIQFLYPNEFANSTFNPENQSIIVNMSDDIFWKSGVPDGLYRLNSEGGLSTPLVLGNYGWVGWEPTLKRFVAHIWQTDKRVTTLLDVQGNETLQFDGNPGIIPSPNGEWIIASYSAKDFLYSSDGELLKKIDPGFFDWFPDSSGFYHLKATCCATDTGELSLYTQTESWEKTRIDNNILPSAGLTIVNP
jgi:hypothetical protein